eukprot:6177559-Pleurochrysis_carterae.AAC.2
MRSSFPDAEPALGDVGWRTVGGVEKAVEKEHRQPERPRWRSCTSCYHTVISSKHSTRWLSKAQKRA